MSSVNPKTARSNTPYATPPTDEARLAEFRHHVAQVRAQVEPELFFHPDRPKPCTVNGVICHTSSEVIAAYAPGKRHTCTPVEWRRIENVVRDCMRLAPAPSPTSTFARIKTATDFVLWCLRTDVPLHAEAMFTPPRVEQYVATQVGHRNPRGRAAVRTVLRSVGRNCTVKAGWDRPTPRLDTGLRVMPPYTPAEVREYWNAALAQSTGRRRHVIGTILTLGLGAGLTNTEMFELRTSQVLDHPLHDGLLVLALVDRLVPVRAELSDMLRLLCDAQPEGRLIGGRAEQVNNYKQLTQMVQNLTIPTSLPALSLRRLRTTWIVQCLVGGSNPSEVCHAAGISVDFASTITRYLPYVPVRDGQDAWMLWAAGLPMDGGNA